MEKNTSKKNNVNNELSKLPPQAVEIENHIIGKILNEPNSLAIISGILKPECFYLHQNSLIYNILLEMNNNDEYIDYLTLIEKLKSKNLLDEIGGQYAISLYLTLSPSFQVDKYCYIIFDLFVKRELITLFQETTNKLYVNDCDISDIIDLVYEKLEIIFDKLSNEQIHHIKSTIDKTIDEIEGFSDGTMTAYIKTGIPLFDNHIYITRKFIIGIAASRGAGKTRFLIHLMKSIYKRNDNISTLWYSMEDSDSKIVRLFAADEVNLTDQQMQSKGYNLSLLEKEKLKNVIREFSSYDIDFVTHQENIGTISKTFNQFIKKRPNTNFFFLIIDNIMLIEDLYQNTDSNTLVIEDKIAASFRRIINNSDKLGKEVCIIFLHHMTKEMESKVNFEEAYRPKLAHMKGSSRFADIANAILLINKPGMHKDLIKKHSDLPDILCEYPNNILKLEKREKILQQILIIEVAKNRDGEMSDDNLAIERYLTDFGKMSFIPIKCKKK